MIIRHIHVNACDSTQDLLKEQLNNPDTLENILVSCDNQNKGRGRGDHQWLSYPGTLCFSLNLLPHREPSFTALELSLLVVNFFQKKGQTLKLKWPNDIWDQHNLKCCGILVQGHKNFYLAGIGLNLFPGGNFGGVYSEFFDFDKRQWSLELGSYLLENRYESTERLKRDWLSHCGHLNQFVKISEGETITEGIFQGIGDHGEALLCSNGKTHHLYNGSLSLQ